MARKKAYDNTSISMLKDEERVRKRPAVIFGSDDLEGCKHAVFEILSNAIDEAREGYGDLIVVTRYEDLSVDVEDFGRGCPVEATDRKKTGSYFHWKPDREVFTEIDIPAEYFQDVIRRQAVVNQGITFRFRNQVAGKFEVTEYCYEHGITQ